MNIGIDLRALQTGHKFRGIGEVAKQITNKIIKLAKDEDINFIFYEYSGDNPRELLDIPKNLSYEVVDLGIMPELDKDVSKLQKIFRSYKELFGSPIKDSNRSDVFLQFDYAFGVPKNTRTILIKHDLIPYIFWSKYFQSPAISFRQKHFKAALRTIYANYKYKRILKRSVLNADKIISVSNSTKKDLNKLLKVPNAKIEVVHLGVDIKPSKTVDVQKDVTMPKKPYILFVGAADARRKVEDLVDAFNNLKANGIDIQLALVGENFKSHSKVPNENVKKAICASSYSNDILTMGYVSDHIKHQLYKNAIAFVYPTRYEGFGIPILESMLLECPIITYNNSSIPEVGGDFAIYTSDWNGIKEEVTKLIKQPKKERLVMIKKALKHAERFTWDESAKKIFNVLKEKA